MLTGPAGADLAGGGAGSDRLLNAEPIRCPTATTVAARY
jgi:hypothetical protein